MARTDITPQDALGSYPSLPLSADSADFTWTAGDATNNNAVTLAGRELVLVRNDGTSAQDVTFQSVADQYNRTGNIDTYSVGAGEYAMFGPFKVPGWKQGDGKLYIDPASTDLKFAVIRLPS